MKKVDDLPFVTLHSKDALMASFICVASGWISKGKVLTVQARSNEHHFCKWGIDPKAKREQTFVNERVKYVAVDTVGYDALKQQEQQQQQVENEVDEQTPHDDGDNEGGVKRTHMEETSEENLTELAQYV
jgi:hypothetical protein